MFCKYCGEFLEEEALFCTKCGKGVNGDTAAIEPMPFGGKFADKTFYLANLFFTLAIVFAFVANLIGGNVNVPILEIFAIVAFWKLHNSAKLGDPLVSYVSPLKTLRIVIQIERVIIWIAVGVLSVVGLLMIALGATANTELINSFVEEINEGAVTLSGFEGQLDGGVDFLIANIGLFLIVFGAIFFFIAVVCLVFNLTMYRSFHKCAASYEESAKFGVYNIEKQESVRKWLIFNVVCSCISVLGSLNASNAAGALSTAAVAFEIIYFVLFIKFLKVEK